MLTTPPYVNKRFLVLFLDLLNYFVQFYPFTHFTADSSWKTLPCYNFLNGTIRQMEVSGGFLHPKPGG